MKVIYESTSKEISKCWVNPFVVKLAIYINEDNYKKIMFYKGHDFTCKSLSQVILLVAVSCHTQIIVFPVVHYASL